MVGGKTSVITLSELELAFADDQIYKGEAIADKIRDAANARIAASTKMDDLVKKIATEAADASDAKIHAWLEAHRAAPELSELCLNGLHGASICSN